MAVLQAPLRAQPGSQLGPRLFRKQALKLGRIEHKGRTIDFSRDYAASLVDAFNAGALDVVPFVLADSDNRHTNDPERYRGAVKALELTDDGIDAIVELADKGAELVREHPGLGVSARIIEDFERADGRRFPRVMQHLCGTLDPQLGGLRGWEAISAETSLSGTYDPSQVIDLTASDYVKTLTDKHLEELQGLKPEERAAKAAELLGVKAEDPKPEADAAKPDPAKPEGEAKQSLFERFFGRKKVEGQDDDAEAALTQIVAEAAKGGGEGDPAKAEEAVAALSAESQAAIDLAATRASSAEATAKDALRQLREANWNSEREARALKGVPTAVLDLCEPVLSGEKQVIELSAGQTVDAGEVLRKVLDQFEGVVDLSAADGSDTGEEPGDKEAEEIAERWAKHSRGEKA